MSDRMDSGTRDLLSPWANLYNDLQQAIWRHCESLSDEGLRELGAAAASPTETNCWWATYRVARILFDAVKSEQYRRRTNVARGLVDHHA